MILKTIQKIIRSVKLLLNYCQLEKRIREGVLKNLPTILGDLQLENSYHDILDLAVIGRNNWQMYGSRKPHHSAYGLTHVINYNYIYSDDNSPMPISKQLEEGEEPDPLMQKTEVSQFTNKQLLHLLSVRNFDRKYVYNYSEEEVHFVFNKVKALFTPDKYKLVVIPSYRTPELVIKKAFNTFSFNHHVIKDINKKAYLSSLAIADYIIVTCDSTSMISEAALTGKPIYVAMFKPKRTSSRFTKFYTQFSKLGITKELTERVDNWSYDKLDEINRIVPIIKQKMKSNGII